MAAHGGGYGVVRGPLQGDGLRPGQVLQARCRQGQDRGIDPGLIHGGEAAVVEIQQR
jgi:hypothetical protein